MGHPMLQQFLEVANHLLDFFVVAVQRAPTQIEILLKVCDGCGVLPLLPKKRTAITVDFCKFWL